MKRFWCEFRRDWDLVLVLLVLCAIATCAQAAAATLQYAATGTAPHVELNAATVKGPINVRVAPCAAPGVKFYLDNVFKNVEGGCPYDYGGDNFLIDTKTLAEGAHTIEAREGNGITVRATATFAVQNAVPPPACVIPPIPAGIQDTACPSGIGTFPQVRDCTEACGAAVAVCTPWRPATPSPEVCPPRFTARMTASPPTIFRGAASILTWSVDDPAAQCVSPAGPSSSGWLSVSPAASTAYDFTCQHGTMASIASITVTVIERPPFKHQCSPYPSTKITVIESLPAGVSDRYTALVIQDCVLPGGGRIVEGIFGNRPRGTFTIPLTWADVQPTDSEAEFGNQQVAAYRAAHP